MRYSQAAVVALLPVLAASGGRHIKKEAVTLKVTTAAAQPQRFVIVSHGLMVRFANLNPPLFSNAPMPDTLTTPAYIGLMGVGDAQVVAVGSGVQLTAEMRNPMDNAIKPQTITGHRLAIRHPQMNEPFEATAVEHPTQATYITNEEVKAVLATPGIDHTIRVVDIGSENFAIGIIHRGASVAGGGGRGGGARAAAPAPVQCGDQMAALPTDAVAGAITHDSQTEGYYIVSGGGTLITGGRIVNGTRSAPDAAVTKELNGPSCSGSIAGPGVVRRAVTTGDIIIIPAGVPHGWTEITDHVDYLSFRPSDHVLEAGYVHPAIKK